MVITEHFAWAHMGKTGGDATAKMFAAVPGLVEWAHSPDSTAKHDSFALHAAAISGRLRVMNIRRLPAWILSRTHHMRIHGPGPGDQRHVMASADEMAENTHGDFVLRRMSDGPRFPIQRWLRQEFLADDVAALLEHFGQLTEPAREGIAGVAYRAKSYDHDIRSTFTAEQIRRMYSLNPRWAEVEWRVYGDRLDLADSRPRELRRPRSMPARFSRLAGSLRRRTASQDPDAGEEVARAEPQPSDECDIDGQLNDYAGPQLDAIDRELAAEGPRLDAYRHFRGLPNWTWALLLGRRYTSYPSILETLPQIPGPELQMQWDGVQGLTLLSRSLAFYQHVKSIQSVHGTGMSPNTRILDFGCRWGRLTRFFCRDVDVGCLHACDAAEDFLEVCRRSRLPAVLHRVEVGSDSVPEGDFDLAYSHSAFTQLPESGAGADLEALHESLIPGGLLILTIQPPAAGKEGPARSLPDLRQRWGDRFDLVDVTVLLEDIHRVAVTLRKV